MRRKHLKIITGCLGVLALTTLTTSCSNSNTEQQKEQIDSIEIVSDLKDISLETKQTFVSDTIEVKCFNSDKKEIKQETQLFLYPTQENNIDIQIIDNKIHIGESKEVGLYNYKLVATSNDYSVISNVKDFNIEIYKQSVLPDSIELIGSETTSMEYPTSKTVTYQLSAKLKGEEITEFDPRCNFNIEIESSTTGKTVDLFGNPIFNLERKLKIFDLNISKNIDKSWQGQYVLKINVSLLSDPSVATTKTVTLDLVYGVEYIDTEMKYVYARDDVESEWYLQSIPSDAVKIDSNRVLRSIKDVAVTKIANNFCSNSGITNLLIAEIPEYVKTVGEYVFYNQEALNSFFIPTVEIIGESAFENCPLGCINPNWHVSFKYVGKNAFKNCKQLEVRYAYDMIALGESCFKGTDLCNIHFGPNLAYIGSEALYDCSRLTDIHIQATTPPYLMGDFIGGSTPIGFKIHVPASALDSYRNDQNWSIYSQNLIGDEV